VADWSPATALAHGSIIDRHLMPTLGAKAVTKITTADIDALYARLRSRGVPGGRPLGAASVRRTHVVVHAALAQAVRWKWLRINPASNATPPRVVTPEIVPPAPGDVARLLAVLADLDAPLHAYVRLAAIRRPPQPDRRAALVRRRLRRRHGHVRPVSTKKAPTSSARS